MDQVSEIRLTKMTDEALAMCGWPSKEQAELIIRDILMMADEWDTGRLPLSEVQRLCTPQERFLTARFVKPMPQSFADLLDALIAETKDEKDNYAYTTDHGVFLDEDLTDGKAKQERTEDGRIRIRFPQRQPWERYPNRRGDTQEARDGKRADPYYAEDQADRMRVANEFTEKKMGAGPDEEVRRN